MPQGGPIPVYFSHSYRLADRDVNRFFAELFWKKRFSLSVDPKSPTLSVPRLEHMMRGAACFAAVVTLREEQPRYRCSPYILFEYGLAVQARKPRLVFVEQDVSDRLFVADENVVVFNREPAKLAAYAKSYLGRVAELARKAAPYRTVGLRLRQKVGLVLAEGSRATPYTSQLHDRIGQLLDVAGYTPEVVNPRFENVSQFAALLDSYDFLIADVGPAVLPGWVFPFVYGRFVPAIKLMHLERTNAPEDRPQLLTGHLLGDVPLDQEPIVFWQDPEELLAKLAEQLEKLKRPRAEYGGDEKGEAYFNSVGRATATVFVSNAADANRTAEFLAEELSRYNIGFFQYRYRNTIQPGATWPDELAARLGDSQIVALLITRGFRESEWCQRELMLAEQLSREGRLVIVPFFLEEVEASPRLPQGKDLASLAPKEQARAVRETLDSMLSTRLPITVESASRTREGANMDEADVAIVTVLPEEYAAVLRHVENHAAPKQGQDPNLYAWRLGTLPQVGGPGRYSVVVAMAGQPGTSSAAVAILQTVQRWKPRYVLLVGIAGGFPGDELGKGDVVVAHVIYGYEYGKLGDTGFQPRPDFTYRVDHPLVTSALALPLVVTKWYGSVRVEPPEGPVAPRVHRGAVASGDKVVDAAYDPFFAAVRKQWPKLRAVEMEGAGAAAGIESVQAQGSRVGFAMIRGISDLPVMSAPADDGEAPPAAMQTAERDAWKAYACETAACFATELIKRGWPVGPSSQR